MYLTGFADEAGSDIDTQIRATQMLGWNYIESRGINGCNIHDIPDPEFDAVQQKLEEAGIRINCFGSTIANWSKKITDPFDITLAEIERAIPRMHRLSTKLVRIMSYAVLQDREPDDQMEEERFKRLREIKKRFDDAGIIAVHENCNNYGGMGWKYTQRLLDNVPGLKLVFDTGNPVFTDDRNHPKPYPKQSSWEFYTCVKEHLAYVHIKDGVWDSSKATVEYTYPGEGNGDVEKILKDLLENGYDGGISIEPHLAVVFHDDRVQSEDEVRFNSYVEYGRRLMNLLEKIRPAVRGA